MTSSILCISSEDRKVVPNGYTPNTNTSYGEEEYPDKNYLILAHVQNLIPSSPFLQDMI